MGSPAQADSGADMYLLGTSLPLMPDTAKVDPDFACIRQVAWVLVRMGPRST